MPLNLYIGGGLLIFALLGWGFGAYEHHSYKAYKIEVEATAEKQKFIAEQKDKWDKQVIKETNDAYQTRLNAINTRYGRLHEYCPSPVPDTDSKQNPSVSAGETTNDLFTQRNVIKDCAITTNMLVTLQDILKTTKDQ